MKRVLQWLIGILYHAPAFERLFHTTVYCLKRELRGCGTVLDLGCGPDSPIRYCNVPHSLGVDAFPFYIRKSARDGIHTNYLIADVAQVEFSPKSFDAVVMMEVLEHLSEQDGLRLLEKAGQWAKRCVIVTTPNGYLPQGELGNNPYQTHRSGWEVDYMRRIGFRAYGMAGLGMLRKENTAEAMEDADAVFCTVRWRPTWLWLIIAELTQLFTYFIPSWSFEVFYVRSLSTRD